MNLHSAVFFFFFIFDVSVKSHYCAVIDMAIRLRKKTFRARSSFMNGSCPWTSKKKSWLCNRCWTRGLKPPSSNRCAAALQSSTYEICHKQGYFPSWKKHIVLHHAIHSMGSLFCLFSWGLRCVKQQTHVDDAVTD